MSAAELRDLLEREPFLPLRVKPTSGNRIDIRSPGLVVAMKSRLLVAGPGSDHCTLVPYLYIAAVQFMGNGNGSTGRKPRR